MESVISTMKPAVHLFLLLLVFGVFYASCDETWCYDKPSCGPKTWGSIGYCSGNKQSPIKIVTKDARSNPCLGSLTFTGYEDRKRPKTLENTGHSAEVEMKSGATISSPGLPFTYYLKSFHFHWGTFNHRGSEHAIDGSHYLMEMHLVHTKNDMTVKEAGKDPEGIAVVAFFIKRSKERASISSWKTLADLLEKIPEKNNSVDLDGEFSLGSLLKDVDLSTYFQYRGSLTTPGCNEAVTWIIFPDPIVVSNNVAKKFTNSLYFTTVKENRRMQKNYRPLQRRNNREVLYFQEHKYKRYEKYCSEQKKFEPQEQGN